MAFDPRRARVLREVKGLKQDELRGMSQNQVTRCEKNGTDSIKLLEGLATALDCAEGFLLGRLFPTLDLDDRAAVRQAASRMAFDAFVDRPGTASHQQQRCARLLSHSAAPLTADDWQTLADLIDRAVPPAGDARTLRAVNDYD